MTVLLEDPSGIVIPEKPYVWLKGMYVREWRQEIRELCGVIPYADVIRQFSPGHQVGGKILAIFFNGRTAVTFNRSQCDEHIVPWSDIFWGFPRILVCKGGNGLVRECCRYFINKFNDAA